MATVLDGEVALTLARRRAAERESFLTEIREHLRNVAALGIAMEPFEGGFFSVLRHEINLIESELFPDGLTADRLRRKKISPRKRFVVYERDDFTCQRCGFHFDPIAVLYGPRDRHGRQRLPRGGITLDHIIPEAEGGATVVANLQTTCDWCNQDKGLSLD